MVDRSWPWRDLRVIGSNSREGKITDQGMVASGGVASQRGPVTALLCWSTLG